MIRRALLLCSLPAFAAALPVRAVAGDAPALTQPQQTLLQLLLQQVRFWNDKGDYARAASALAQAEQMAPDDPGVMTAKGQLAAARGDVAGADRTLQALTRVAPGSQQQIDLQQSINLHAVSAEELQTLRAQAASTVTTQREQAAEGYRRLFGDRPPRSIALEYYQAQAGSAGGWQRARTGLADLVARDPSDAHLQLALAQVLTYRPDTRLQGVARLRSLVAMPGQSPAVVTEAQRALRQALLWLPADRSSVPELDLYAHANPNDRAVADRLHLSQTEGTPDPAAVARGSGFKALAAGHDADAEAAFRDALTRNARDADALGGLGLVRSHQGRAGEARDLLQQAIAADPEHAARWQPALEGLSVGDQYAQARALIARGRTAEAEQALGKLIASASDPTGAQLMLADAQARARRDGAAEATYRKIIARQPGNADALLGLARIASRQGRLDEVHALLDRLGGRRSREARQMLADLNRGDTLRDVDAAGSPGEKIALLRRGIERDGSDPWLRLRLAQALYADGQKGEAATVMAPIADARAPSADALRAGIIFAGQSGDLATASGLLARLPRRAATPQTRQVAAQVALASEIANARTVGDEGHATLIALARRPDPTGVRGTQIADALYDLGDRRGAARALAVAETATPHPSAAQRLAYAGTYLKLGDTSGARRTLGALDQTVASGTERLTPEQDAARAQVAEGIAIVASDTLNDQGRRASAYDQLAPVLARDPQAAAPKLALARLYQSDSQPRKALALDLAVLERTPSDLDARLAAVRASVDCGEVVQAASLAQDALVIAPQDPRSWLAVASVEQARGHGRAALDALRHARALRRQQLGTDSTSTAVLAADYVPAPDDGNPFRHTQDRPPAESWGGDVGPDDRSGLLAATDVAPKPAPDAMLSSIDTQISTLRSDMAPKYDVNVGVRTRSGSGGLDSLTQFTVPLTATWPVGAGSGHWWASATPTVVSSGTLDSGTATQGLYGSLALGELSGFDGGSNQSGVALQVGYANRWLSADVGSSPLGFRIANVLGGVEIAPRLSQNVTLRLTGERRAVTDSVLSYAGLRDPHTGTTWGGVTRLRGHGQIEITSGTSVLYAGAGYDSIHGQHVKSNGEVEAGIGGSVQVWREADQAVRVGLDLIYFGYDHNLRFFTLGQGGYFSPQSYVAASIPVTYTGKSGPWQWDATGAIGYQSYDEHGTNYYPDDPGLQAQLAAGNLTRVHTGRSQSGLAGRANGRIEYAVTPNLRLGATASYQRTGNWNEGQAMLTARYTAPETP